MRALTIVFAIGLAVARPPMAHSRRIRCSLDEDSRHDRPRYR
jgi:hypothetical protein